MEGLGPGMFVAQGRRVLDRFCLVESLGVLGLQGFARV